jgi:hypothetical protein
MFTTFPYSKYPKIPQPAGHIMQALGIDFRILPVVLEMLFPFSAGAPSIGNPPAKTAIPPTPHLMKSLRLIPDISFLSTEGEG